MAVLAGIDEAGYGPILGPLVVSASAFSIHDSLLKADLWYHLRKSIAIKKKHLAGRLLITDSKKAYSRAVGIRHIQRTTLAVLRCLGTEPTDLNSLLTFLSPDCPQRLKTYPWYYSPDTVGIPLDYDSVDIKIASEVFSADMAGQGISLLGIQSHCLDVAYYNKLVAAVKNKASVLFSTTAALIKSIWDNCRDENIQVIVDRQGGRSRYRKNLQRMFSDLELAVINESQNSSSYELKNTDRKMRIHFVIRADQRYMPVCLASMVSKYLRELLVARINSYFLSRHRQLKPTAGYFKDGRRFITDIKTYIPDIKYDSNLLIRCR
jgi:ribonuclease HII